MGCWWWLWLCSTGVNNGDKSCSDADSERVGCAGEGEGVGREGGDVARTDDEGKNNKEGDVLCGCNDGRLGEGVGMGMMKDGKRGSNVSWTGNRGAKSHGSDNERTGDTGEGAGIGRETASDSKRGNNVVWTGDGGNCGGIDSKSHGSDNGQTSNMGGGEDKGRGTGSNGEQDNDLASTGDAGACEGSGRRTLSPRSLKH